MNDSQHGTRTQLVADCLRTMIVAGDLSPGQRISEREVGELLGGGPLGLSRTPLREAFKILAAERLVSIAPNCGATVTALSLREVEEAIELLVGLESLAAEPACARIGAVELAVIVALHADMCAAFDGQQLMRYFEINQEIHQRVVNAAGNHTLSRIYADESARVRRYRYAGNRRHERWANAVAEHGQMVAALSARNGALLRELLRTHHHNGWVIARRLLEDEFAAAAR